MASESRWKIRPATREDVPSILWLTQLFAESIKWNPNPNQDKTPLVREIGERELLRDGFGDTPRFHVLLAELNTEEDVPVNVSAPVSQTASPSSAMPHDERIVGQVFYYYAYSTWEGRMLYLEDLFVREGGSWSDGVGLSLMQECARIAESNECCRVQWLVSERNEPALSMYKRIGATFLLEWVSVRLMRPTLGEFASGITTTNSSSSGTLTENGSAPSQLWTIRRATERDVPSVLWLTQLLAEYEEEPHAPVIGEKELLRDGFCDRPYFCVLLAELPNTENLIPVETPVNGASTSTVCVSSTMPHDDRIVGHAFLYYAYSVREGRVLYLEDLFVRKEYRNRGIGQSLIRECARVAERNDSCRLQWSVLDWNEPAIAFYERIGATFAKEWKTMRIARPRISEFVAEELST